MIICICKNIRVKDISHAKSLNKSIKDIISENNLCSGCKKCLPYIKKSFKE